MPIGDVKINPVSGQAAPAARRSSRWCVRWAFNAVTTIAGMWIVLRLCADFGSVVRRRVRTFRHCTRRLSSCSRNCRRSALRFGAVAICVRSVRRDSRRWRLAVLSPPLRSIACRTLNVPRSKSTSCQRSPSPSPSRKPSAVTIDNRPPRRSALATSNSARACTGLSGSIPLGTNPQPLCP